MSILKIILHVLLPLFFMSSSLVVLLMSFCRSPFAFSFVGHGSILLFSLVVTYLLHFVSTNYTFQFKVAHKVGGQHPLLPFGSAFQILRSDLETANAVIILCSSGKLIYLRDIQCDNDLQLNTRS